METFKIGDVVTLNSSQIKMTMVSEILNNFVLCAWFDVNGQLQKHSFHINSLKPSD